jgi:hypothetical protein
MQSREESIWNRTAHLRQDKTGLYKSRLEKCPSHFRSRGYVNGYCNTRVVPDPVGRK